MKQKVIKIKTIARGKTKQEHFPVVAIGASVGGLKAVVQFLKYLPVNTGMAYIYVQHLSPYHKSFLTSILSRVTKMKVQEIEDMAHMKPDNIYVIPNNKGIEVVNGHIRLLPRAKGGTAISIDTLFTSLAATHKKNVIGVIFSGNGNDGTKGIEAIKKAGGLTFAQDASAQAVSMPESAISSGAVDYTLSPKEMALELVRLYKSGFRNLSPGKNELAGDDDADLKTIFRLLQKEISVDFSHYKMTTVKRRIHYRMLQVNISSLGEYVKLLRRKKEEADALYKDLLINVTGFFRDAATFQYLKSSFLPKLLNRKTTDKSLRIWVPACSTGEEAYSLAMLVLELQEKRKHKIPVQIFATDISKQAIRNARVGEYEESDLKPLSPQRVKRFFAKTGDTYHVIKELREMCVFAPHNILKDPPFSRIDFVSCRNLLIYFDKPTQKRALSSLHFALNADGYLMLGKSESTDASLSLFATFNPKYKIYSRKKNTGAIKVPELENHGKKAKRKTNSRPLIQAVKNAANSSALEQVIDSVLLKEYMPACAIINKHMEILQFRGSASLYLVHPPGKASLNILKMARTDFSIELRSTILQAIKTKSPVRRPGIEMNPDAVRGDSQIVTLEVSPLRIEWDEPLLLVVFTTQDPERSPEDDNGRKRGSASSLSRKEQKIKRLTRDLHKARTEVHAIIESQESAYEELQVANEEIVSANEEFQTLNEELETSKEEIEATNEELISTNQELQMRNDLLEESYNYSEAIIATIHEPMLILNETLTIKSASPAFYKKFHSGKENTEGKSIWELGNKQWAIPELVKLLEDVRAKNKDFKDFEVVLTFPGIGEKLLLLNAHRIVQKNHKEQLILLAINDITERFHHYRREKELLAKDLRLRKEDNEALEKSVRRRTRQLELKNKELEEANKDLTSFTYVSSHDLQEPLRKIQNFATCIHQEEEQNLSENGKLYFSRMREIAKRMQILLEDLLKYSRTKSSENQFENVDLNALADEVAGDFEDAVRENNGKISIGKLGHAGVIPFQFRQLMHNLVSNSLKFAKRNVAPDITIKSNIVTGEKAGVAKLVSAKKYLHIIYRDNGIGFAPEYKERIFEVFQRLHSTEEYRGTGIGLAICKRIVENHHGEITANGKLNKGARFDIYIPLNLK